MWLFLCTWGDNLGDMRHCVVGAESFEVDTVRDVSRGLLACGFTALGVVVWRLDIGCCRT